MDDQFVVFLRSVPENRISPSGAVPRSYASRDGFSIEVKAIRSEYITMRFTAPDGRAVIALIPRDLWGSTDPAVMLVAEDVRRSVIRTIRASKDRQMGVRVTNSRSSTGDDHGDNHGAQVFYRVCEPSCQANRGCYHRYELFRAQNKVTWRAFAFVGVRFNRSIFGYVKLNQSSAKHMAYIFLT